MGRHDRFGLTVLLGQYTQRLDDKNRLTVPAKFRADFDPDIVVTRGLDDCLWAFTKDGWDAFHTEQSSRLDGFSREARQMRRFFFSAAHEAKLDKQGRVALPAGLMDHAGLDREIVVTGHRRAPRDLESRQVGGRRQRVTREHGRCCGAFRA